MKNTFTKKDRLILKSDFQNLRFGSRFFVSEVLVFYTKSNNQRSRLGIAVSKKFGNAVKRNLFKRKVREYFRKSKEISGKNLDILVSPNMKNIKRYSYDYSCIFSKIDNSMNEAIKKGFKR